MTRFKAIFFDAAGTLLHAHPSVGHVYAEVISRYGATVDPVAMEQAFRKTFAERRGHSSSLIPHPSSLHDEGYEWWRALVFDTMDSLGVSVNDRNAFFRELYWRFAETDVWRLFPDAFPALLAARGYGLRVALLSNWDVRLRRLLEGMGVMSLFDTAIISTEVGIEKPDARIFRLACERLGVQPEEALHVGDSVREDIEGARAAGLEAVLIDRNGVADPTRGVVCDLRQVGSIVQGVLPKS